MRANEFITERQRVDEFVPIVLGGLTALGIGMQGYETYKDIQDYQSGRIDKDELTRRIGTDAAIAVVGGAIGKGVAGLYGAGKGAINIFKNAMKHKDKANTAADATKLAKPGTTIQTPKGPRVAGVDGKPTVIDPTQRGARADIRKIKQQAKKQPDAVTPGAATASAATKKADDLAKKKPGAGKPGAATTSIGSKILKSPVTRGAAAAALANQTTGAGDAISNFLGNVKRSQAAKRNATGTGYLYKGKQDIDKSKVVQIGKAKDGI